MELEYQSAAKNANMWLYQSKWLSSKDVSLSLSFTLNSLCSLFPDSVRVFSFLFYLHIYDVVYSGAFHVRESEASRKQWVVCDLWQSGLYLRIEGSIRGWNIKLQTTHLQPLTALSESREKSLLSMWNVGPVCQCKSLANCDTVTLCIRQVWWNYWNCKLC